MDWLIWSGAFVASVGLLVKSADWFVDSADHVGRMLGVPAFIMGITLVALGTSLPELATSLVAISRDQTAFIIGNAVGSNVTNILLVMGFMALPLSRYKVGRDMGGLDLPVLFVSGALIALFCLTGRVVGRGEGLILLLAYLIYLYFLVIEHRAGNGEDKAPKKVWPFLLLIGSGAGIYFGAEFTLTATIRLSRLAGFADTSVLALSAVAIGTSLPELTVSITAARKGQLDLAVGNVLGSNIFNSLVVIGLPAIITPLAAPSSVISVGLPYMAVATLMAYLSLVRRRLSRPMGAMFLLVYLAFLLALFGLI